MDVNLPMLYSARESLMTRRFKILRLITMSFFLLACGGVQAVTPSPTGLFEDLASPVVNIEPTLSALPTEPPANLPSEPTLTPLPTIPQPGIETGCVITAPPAELKLDSFYKKYCSAGGLPVLASSKVPDKALRAAWTVVLNMLSARQDLLQKLYYSGVKIAVIGAHEVTTDIPEYRGLYTQFPGTDWNARTRGIGATSFIPVSSGAEENLLCYANDPYRGENIMVHEFGHTVLGLGLDEAFRGRVKAAYDSAMAAGLWANTYAASNADEYWAEGTQDWFNANLQADPPNGIHNSVNTRAELQTYDPALYTLLAEVYPSYDWTPACP